MPQAVVVAALPYAIPAIVGAAGAIVGSKIQSNAAKRATQAQEHAADQALAYEREKEQARRDAYQKAMDIYQQNYNAWYSQWGNAGTNRYGMPSGITIPGSTPPKAQVRAMGAQGVVPYQAQPQQQQGLTLGDMASGRQPAQPGAPPPMMASAPTTPPRTLADVGSWNDWTKYMPGVGA